MNVAICLSGLVRNYPKYLDRIAELGRKFKADFFIHTWSQKDVGGAKLSEQDFENINTVLQPQCFDVEELEKISPQVEALNKWNTKREDPWSHNADRYGFMFYSIFASNYFRCIWSKIGKKYDLVMRHRFDFAFDSLELEDLDLEKLNVVPINRNDGVADIWAAGPSDIMSCYSDVFNHFDECAAEIKFLRPEDILKVWLDKNKVPIHIVKKPYQIK